MSSHVLVSVPQLVEVSSNNYKVYYHGSLLGRVYAEHEHDPHSHISYLIWIAEHSITWDQQAFSSRSQAINNLVSRYYKAD